MALHPVCSLLLVALVVSVVIFLEVLAGALNNDWIILTMLVPLFLTPLPLLLLKCCCGGDDNLFSSSPRGAHWAEFLSGFFFVGVIAIPAILYSTGQVELVSMLLSLGGVIVAILAAAGGACLSARAESDAFFAFS